MNTPVESDEMRWLTYAPARAQLAALDEELRDLLACRDTALAEAATYLVSRGGKRIRPALMCTAAGAAVAAPGSDGRSAGRDDDRLRRAAAAVELLHVASLYHDDVMDRAELRRGARTVNAHRGDAVALTAGTFLFARGMGTLASLDEQIAAWAGQSTLALALGQLQEAENTFNLDQRLRSYVQIAARKTAALFEFSCRAGARLGGAPVPVVEALGRYGRALGLAFQTTDDALDLTATEEEAGKLVGTDLREGVYGLPVLLALQRKNPHSGELRRILEQDRLTEADHREARRLVAASGGLTGAGAIAREHARQATSSLAGLADGEAKVSLMRLTGYVTLRRY